jgi:hypothetical protein
MEFGQSETGLAVKITPAPDTYARTKAPDGQVDHALNRSVGRMHLLRKDADFEAFQRVMIEAHH